jgi:hypothetical protein
VTIRDLLQKWAARRAELSRLNASVSADALLGDVLTDLEAVDTATTEATATLAEAARVSGLHPDTISRRIRKNKVRNYGTATRPRVRLSEIPERATTAPAKDAVAPAARESQSSASRAAGMLTLDAVASRRA